MPDFDVRTTVPFPMYNSTLRAPARFLRLRFLLPVVVFFAFWQFALPGARESGLAPWGLFRHSGNETSIPAGQSLPQDKLKEPLDHDRDRKPTAPEDQKSINEAGDVEKPNETKPHRGEQEIIQEHKHFDHVCGVITGGERIVITVNTGATEVLDRVPTQLRTSLLCAPNVYIYSDLGHMLGEYQVYDALDTTPASVMEGNSDFDLYRKQLELNNPLLVAEFLKGMKDPRASDVLAGWTLDKYKKLHILEKAWDMQPDMDWYLHIDADSYVVWSTLVAWLAKLDPTKESYLGSLSFINNLPFAHGGSGMLLSGAAMRNFVVEHNGTANRWDYKMQNECCADWVLAQILKEYGMELMNSWPTIQGESQSTILFDPGHWCQPLATMHHVSPLEAAQFGDFEEKRKNKTLPLTFEELFTGLVSDLIPEELDDWDNLYQVDSGKPVADIKSADDCFNACRNNEDCFQALWKGHECIVLTEAITLGRKHDEEGSKKWKSFWNKKKIAEWVGKEKCTGSIEFPFQEGKSWWSRD